MSNEFRWRLMLQAAPNRVFCALVRAASIEGRVCAVENYGTTLTFLPSRRRPDLLGQMRATVRPCSSGSMVCIEPANAGPVTPDSMSAQATAVATLVHSLSEHYRVERELSSVS